MKKKQPVLHTDDSGTFECPICPGSYVKHIGGNADHYFTVGSIIETPEGKRAVTAHNPQVSYPVANITPVLQHLSIQCLMCLEYKEIDIPLAGFLAWKGGKLIQEALPEVPIPVRELMISQTCGECFKKLCEPENTFGDARLLAVEPEEPTLEYKEIDIPYQPKTGEHCHCKPGVYRDNCPDCEGTGWVIDFQAIRNRRKR